MTNSVDAAPQSLAHAGVLSLLREALVYDPPGVVLDGTVQYTMGGSISVPEAPGVYFIHDLRGVLYVGRTVNLYHRYFQHYWDSHNTGVTAVLRRPVGRLEFSWMTVDACDLAALERDLIRAFQPLCNRLLYKTN